MLLLQNPDIFSPDPAAFLAVRGLAFLADFAFALVFFAFFAISILPRS